MSSQIEQNYQNHTRIAWANYITTAVIGGGVVVAAIYLFRHPSFTAAYMVLIALAATAVAYMSRSNAIKVQDRLIRLEERLRLEKLLPEPLRARIPELSVGRLVAIRFADDREVVGLVEKALSGTKRDELKKEIKVWRPDHFRV